MASSLRLLREKFKSALGISREEDTKTIVDKEEIDESVHPPTPGVGEATPSGRRPRWQLVFLSATVCGIELCYAAETAYVSPTLLNIGVPERFMTLAWCLSPLLGFFLTPLLGSASDTCRAKLGRRRPFILLLSAGIVTGLVLVPNGRDIGVALGDSKDGHLDGHNISIPTSPPIENTTQADNVTTPATELPPTGDYPTSTTSGNASDQWVDITSPDHHAWGVVFTVVGVVLLDFSCDACQSPCRAYLLDVCVPEDHAIGLTTFTIMAGFGGAVGYLVGGLNWENIEIGRQLGGHVRVVFLVVLVLFVIGVSLTVTTAKETPLPELLRKEKKKERKDGENSVINGDIIGNADGQHPGHAVTMETADDNDDYDLQEPTLKTYLLSIIYMPKCLRILCLTNYLNWMALVSYSLYFTDFVGQAVYGGDPRAPSGSPARELYDEGVRMGSCGMAVYSLTCSLYSMVVEKLISRIGARAVYMAGQMTHCCGMLAMGLIRQRWAVIVLSCAAGVLYATIFTIPFILVASYHSQGLFDQIRESGGRKSYIRGLGTDVALVSSMVFFAQLTLSSFIGSLVSAVNSTVAVMVTSSILSFLASVAASRHGGTALHLASEDGHTRVVKLLIQHGADVGAKDKYGQTALHLASRHGRTWVVEMLIQHGADVKARNNHGRTALHLASGAGQTGVVELLIKHGADVGARDKNGRTALHLASGGGQTWVVKLLIQHGADVQARDKDGKTPLDLAQDRDTRRCLKNLAVEVSYHKLMKQSGGVKVDRIKLCFCGPQEAGKSTLVETLQTGSFVGFFRDRMTPDDQPHEPTPGVNVGTTTIPGVGQVSVWDFAGQSEYAVTHSMFMDAENTIFTVLYNIMDDLKKQKREVHWWLCFIKSCNTKSKPYVILVASHADQTDTGHQRASFILELMTSEFKNHMNISNEVFLLDCRKTRKTDMRRLKDLLTRLKTELLEHQRTIPKLCAEIIKCLPKWAKEKCSPKCPVLPWEQYKEAVKEIDRLIDHDFLKASSQYLDHLGEILFVPLQNADPIIVLKPNWLCTDVFGKVMAPENFPIQHLRTSEGEDVDVVTKEEIQRVFKDVADVDLLITLLQQFQLGHTFDGQEFIIPGLLTQTMPPEKWVKTENPAKTVYFGKQTRLMRELKNRPLLWRDGAKCFDSNVESLIKLSPDGRAVNICVRSKQGDKPSCRQMLRKIENILNNVLDEVSPGTAAEERVLSARALEEHREEFYSYGMDQINEAKAEDGKVHHGSLGFSEDVNDLLYGGRDDEEQQGAVGYSHQEPRVYEMHNHTINAGDGAVINMYQGAAGQLGQLQLEGAVGQLQLEGDQGQLELEGDVGQLQLEGDAGQLQPEDNVSETSSDEGLAME
ncbi:hypothetical protein Bbelb_250730 [Branchiostoma belcheri]|nr:hypothetical protein Bbelb_250730 [Branchiostoma belcheri]